MKFVIEICEINICAIIIIVDFEGKVDGKSVCIFIM